MKQSTALFLLLGCFLFQQLPAQPTTKTKEPAVSSASSTTNKPVIKIISSRGGGGHTSASRALFEIFKEDYDVHIINLLTEVLYSLDIVRQITFNRFAAEDFYNFLLRGRWIAQINQLAAVGSWQIQQQQRAIERLLVAYLEENRPDCVISVIPFFNEALLRACQFLNIPFIIVPTDLDETYFVDGLKPPYYEKFAYTIAFNDPEIVQRITPAEIPHEFIHPVGFPVRSSFFEPKDIAAIKKSFNVPVDKPVLMLLMGAQGSSATYSYLKHIIKIKTLPAHHVLVCLGRNEEMREKITALRLPQHISLSIIGFTDKISDLMAISNVLLMKSGSVSVCEAIQIHTPILLDGTRSIPWWEQFNHDFIKKHEFGDVISSYRDLAKLLPKYLTDNNHCQAIKQRMINFTNQQNFSQDIKQLVDKMITKTTKISTVLWRRRRFL